MSAPPDGSGPVVGPGGMAPDDVGARRLVRMHGGTMSAASDGPGRGTTMTIRLPALPAGAAGPERRAEAQAQPQPIAATDESSSTARRVLIVDDNADAADTLALLLTEHGHATHIAYDGASALVAVSEFRPEVILLDLGLPDIDGIEVCKAVRAEPGGGDVTVVALSGWGQNRDKRRTAKAGFDAHLTKPADFAAVTHLLAERRAVGK